MSVKNLSQDELRQLERANQNEIRQYLQKEVMEVVKGNEEIRDDELIGRRWVVTVKHFPEVKVKASRAGASIKKTVPEVSISRS